MKVIGPQVFPRLLSPFDRDGEPRGGAGEDADSHSWTAASDPAWVFPACWLALKVSDLASQTHNYISQSLEMNK